jgi:hypothetical protein
MNDKDLREGLERALRDERRADDECSPWEALAEGTASDEDLARLEELARGDADASRALEAFRPLGPDFEEGVVSSFLASPPATSPAPPPPPTGRSRPARIAAAVAIPLAMAAGVALWVASSPPATDPPSAYDLTILAGTNPMRSVPGDASADVTLSRGAFFQAVARPTAPSKGAVAARALIVRDGHARPWPVALDVSSEGAVKIAGPAASLFPETAGAYEIVIAVGRPDAVPSDQALSACAEGHGICNGLRLVRGRILFVD